MKQDRPKHFGCPRQNEKKKSSFFAQIFKIHSIVVFIVQDKMLKNMINNYKLSKHNDSIYIHVDNMHIYQQTVKLYILPLRRYKDRNNLV